MLVTSLKLVHIPLRKLFRVLARSIQVNRYHYIMPIAPQIQMIQMVLISHWS